MATLILVAPANVLVMPQLEADRDLFASVRAQLPAEQQAAFASFMDEHMDIRHLFEKSEEELFSNTEFAVVEDTGHFSFEEKPEEFAQIVDEFLNKQN